MNCRCVVTAYCSVDVLSYSAYTSTPCFAHQGFVKLSGSTVWEHSWCGDLPNARGVSILKLDAFSCTQLESRSFDTYASASAATDLKNYLDGLSDGDLVIGVSGDEASANLGNARSTLSAWGANVDDVGFRGSFAFIAQKGFASKTMLDKVLTEGASNTAPAKINVILQGSLCTLYHAITAWKKILCSGSCRERKDKAAKSASGLIM